MKKLLARGAGLVLTAAAGLSLASGGGPQPTHFITYTDTGLVYVYFAVGSVTNVPACGAGNIGPDTYKYVFDSTTPAGKTMLEGLIAAHSAGEGVWFTGTGTCTVVSTTETLSKFHTAN